MNDAVRLEIAARLKEARQSARLSQEEAAAGLGVRRQSISAWECGKTMPQAREWYKLGRVYGVSLDYVVYGLRTVPASVYALGPAHRISLTTSASLA